MDAEQHKWYWKGYNDAKKYESFPTQRTWVGLTDEEFQTIYDMGRTPAGMMEMVEAKLRELNEAPAKQRREPLTKEQMYELSNKADDDWMRDGDSQAPWSARSWTYHFVRAIEAAHGIEE